MSPPCRLPGLHTKFSNGCGGRGLGLTEKTAARALVSVDKKEEGVQTVQSNVST